ncbi:N-6 DNA methylase [Holdemania massiliensis]|uniref:N-6 DNA methylase n=1 Tax=Holdemania massiliensis TaxID=1468449 RepID=UPI00351FB25B
MDVIINGIHKMSGSYHAQDIFQDWVQMAGISISNQLFYDQRLEDQYLTLAKKYTDDQLREMCRWTARLVELFEEDINDYLGSIYMMLNAGNSRTGQFFTPFHVCELMARVALTGYSGGKITANEPSVGGGANILAVAKEMRRLGYDYQSLLDVVAQDLDYKCVWMSYLQFSLAGISAICVQGNTLQNEINFILVTPMYCLRGVSP